MAESEEEEFEGSIPLVPLDESAEHYTPVPARNPETPLPRLWKVQPEDDPDDAKSLPESKKKKSEKARSDGEGPRAKVEKARKAERSGKSGRSVEREKDGATKGVLIEETPNLDTYETRQRIRIAIGAALLALSVLIGWTVVRLLSPAPPIEEPVPRSDVATVPGAVNPREKSEREAKVMFDRAREVAKNGKVDLAVSMLTKVVSAYPTTTAGTQAKAALARPRENLPLFLDRPAVVARPGEQANPVPAEPKSEPKVVEASKTEVAGTNGANATLQLPSNSPPPAPDTQPASQPNYRALPPGFHPRSGIAAHPSGWPLEIVGDRDPAPMVLVHGATFIQGRDDGDPFEAPSHHVNLATYYMDQHEVTVRQFNLFQKEAGRRAERERALTKEPTVAEASEDLPVVMVKARDAADYAAWAGKRLPTEAQWEAAARTPEGRLFPWGNEPQKTNPSRNHRQVGPVLAFPADVSPYGVFDLSGNAWEWTKDWYDAKYYQQFRTTPADNPSGPANAPKSMQLVVKGSSKEGIVTKREGIKSEARLPYLGFRCVLVVEGSGNAFEPPPTPGQQAPAKGAQGQMGGAPVPF